MILAKCVYKQSSIEETSNHHVPMRKKEKVGSLWGEKCIYPNQKPAWEINTIKQEQVHVDTRRVLKLYYDISLKKKKKKKKKLYYNIYIRASPSQNSIIFYFTIFKNYFINYTIQFYNIPNISSFILQYYTLK